MLANVVFDKVVVAFGFRDGFDFGLLCGFGLLDLVDEDFFWDREDCVEDKVFFLDFFVGFLLEIAESSSESEDV
jgi:hypothetical protein